MTDIVDRLRDKHCCDDACHCDEAAAEIERLRAALQDLVGAIADPTSQRSIPDALMEARAALTAQPAPSVSPWRPIETAPRDGTLIVALTPAPQFVRWWTDLDGYGEDYPWVGRDGCAYKVSQVIHWMPLPAAPGGDA